jgi:hypothetical protein
MNEPLFEMLRLIGAGIVGGLIASFATHRLTLSRERASGRQNRMREFQNFIVRLKADALAEAFPQGHLDRARAFAVFYRQKKHELRAAAVNVESDLRSKRRAEFDRLMNAAVNFKTEEIIADGKKRVIESLDAILEFLQPNS